MVADDSVVNASAVANYLLQLFPKSIDFRQCASVVRVERGTVTLATGENLKAPEIVCALGCGSANLFPELGIRPRKGQLAITDRYPGFVNHQVLELGYLKSVHESSAQSIAFNVQPRSGGQILIGSSRQFGDDSADVDPKLLSQMIRHAVVFMPAIEHLSITRTWTGFRAATPDKLPFIGPHPEILGVTLATGHEGLGITSSLATAELVSAHIGNGRAAIPFEPYLPSEARLSHALPNRT